LGYAENGFLTVFRKENKDEPNADNDFWSLGNQAHSLNKDFACLDSSLFPARYALGLFKRNQQGKVEYPLRFAANLKPNENGFLKFFKKENSNERYAPAGLYARAAVLTDVFRLGPAGQLTWVGEEFASKQQAEGGGDWRKITEDFSSKKTPILDLSSISI